MKRISSNACYFFSILSPACPFTSLYSHVSVDGTLHCAFAVYAAARETAGMWLQLDGKVFSLKNAGELVLSCHKTWGIRLDNWYFGRKGRDIRLFWMLCYSFRIQRIFLKMGFLKHFVVLFTLVKLLWGIQNSWVVDNKRKWNFGFIIQIFTFISLLLNTFFIHSTIIIKSKVYLFILLYVIFFSSNFCWVSHWGPNQILWKDQIWTNSS